MKYSRIAEEGGESSLIVETEDGSYNLTSTREDLSDFTDLIAVAGICNQTVDSVATNLVEGADEVSPEYVKARRQAPILPEEVWAAGVTYQISEEARQSESESSGDLYIDVYDAERPEVFFKATPSRVVGPDDSVGIRADSTWDVPEPELGLVLHHDEIVGYTIGNDMSSRSIEGENPLYLPQAKIYDRSCALGPRIVTGEDGFDPENATIKMLIRREGATIFSETASTSELVRTFEELVNYYARHDVTPEWGVLLTGTTIVPEDEFTLKEGDTVIIEIEGIGTLENDVIVV